MHVVSTAGHVDHGKSALIRRLTGIDPDRLAEEKARGLTIDLGFAWMTLPSGREIGIVDVPGHERFVHNMLAGVGSVDSTIFVVAANEGWKPQSEEHLQILDLLGARRGVVALTKADLVDAGALEEVAAAVAGRLAATALAAAPIVAVSAVTGQGIDDLVAAVDGMLREDEALSRARPRLFVDRSFSVKGAGTVVTGTLTGGALRVGDEVVVLPAGNTARVRSIQSHKTAREEALPVSRVALNLAGLERAEIRRGDAVVRAGQWEASSVLDVSLRAVRGLDHAVRARGAYKAYIGSAETDARITFHDAAELRAGQEVFARITLAEPVVAAPFDRVVLRDVGRHDTVAGGAILDPHPPAARGPARAAQLRARAAATPADIPTLLVSERGVVARAALGRLAGDDAAPRDAMLLRTLAVSSERFEATVARVEDALSEFHAREPLARGMPAEEARAAAGVAGAREFAEIVEAAPERFASEGPLLRLAAHRVALDPEHERARAALLDELHAAGMSPPAAKDLRARYGEALVRALLDNGELVKISDDLSFGAAQLAEARSAIASAVAREGPLTAARIKDVLGTTRKYAIPLLEHLDATGFTRRDGDVRTVRGTSNV